MRGLRRRAGGAQACPGQEAVRRSAVDMVTELLTSGETVRSPATSFFIIIIIGASRWRRVAGIFQNFQNHFCVQKTKNMYKMQTIKAIW
jgi:hypothetical protein